MVDGEGGQPSRRGGLVSIVPGQFARLRSGGVGRTGDLVEEVGARGGVNGHPGKV